MKYLGALVLAAIACANVRCSLTTQLDGLSGGAGEDATAGASEILAIGGDDGMSVVTDVGAARILPNGDLEGWSARAQLPQPRAGGFATVLSGDLVYAGGIPPGTFETSDVLVADARTAGSPTLWGLTTPFTGTRAGAAGASDGARVFVVGGQHTTDYPSDIQVARRVESGGLGSWSNAGTLPEPFGGGAALTAIAAHGHFYLVGAPKFPSNTSSIRFAKIEDDGTLRTWLSGPDTPQAFHTHALAVVDNHLYVLGGLGINNEAWAQVISTTLGADGTPGPWTAMRALPEGRSYPCAVSARKTIYVLGGVPGAGVAKAFRSVFAASVEPDGSLGAWRVMPALAASGGHMQCAAR